jgi:pimeloyl-ACP methyl ester carboxylesterase
MVMRDGESAMEVFTKGGVGAKNRPNRSKEWMMERFRRQQMHDASRDLQDFVIAAIVPDQMAVLSEPVPMKDFYALDPPTSVIVLEDDVAIDPLRFHPLFTERLRNPTLRSIKSGHGVMFTKPVECARAIAELATES